MRYLFTQCVDWTAPLTHSILFRHTIFTLPSGPVTLCAIGKFPRSSAKRFHVEIPLWFPWGSAQWKVIERTLTITAKILSAGIWNKDKENDSRFLEGCECFLKRPWFFRLFVLVRNLIRKLNRTNSLCTWFFYNMFRHLWWKEKANNSFTSLGDEKGCFLDISITNKKLYSNKAFEIKVFQIKTENVFILTPLEVVLFIIGILYL